MLAASARTRSRTRPLRRITGVRVVCGARGACSRRAFAPARRAGRAKDRPVELEQGSSAMHLRRLVAAISLSLASTLPAFAAETTDGITAFAAKVREPLVPVMVEIRGAPAFIEKQAASQDAAAKREAAMQHHALAAREQDAVLQQAEAAGVPLLMRRKSVPVVPLREHRIEYRFSYLLNGFVAYVPRSRLADLRALPGVRSATPIPETQFY